MYTGHSLVYIGFCVSNIHLYEEAEWFYEGQRIGR